MFDYLKKKLSKKEQKESTNAAWIILDYLKNIFGNNQINEDYSKIEELLAKHKLEELGIDQEKIIDQDYDAELGEEYNELSDQEKINKLVQKMIKKFMIYEIYKKMNPRQVAGETAQQNEKNNRAMGRLDKLTIASLLSDQEESVYAKKTIIDVLRGALKDLAKTFSLAANFQSGLVKDVIRLTNLMDQNILSEPLLRKGAQNIIKALNIINDIQQLNAEKEVKNFEEYLSKGQQNMSQATTIDKVEKSFQENVNKQTNKDTGPSI